VAFRFPGLEDLVHDRLQQIHREYDTDFHQLVETVELAVQEGENIIIDDVRWVLEMEEHYSSYLLRTEKEAIEAEIRRLVSQFHYNNRILLYEEIREHLYRYRRQYLKDRERLPDTDSKEERFNLHLRHNAHLNQSIREQLLKWVRDPRIRIGCSLSLGLHNESTGVVRYNPKWAKDSDRLIDQKAIRLTDHSLVLTHVGDENFIVPLLSTDLRGII
ncbi:MAG: hypothetical protein ACXAE3_17340, partial [Candidatus Kariarchaeaceae archaeon]